MKPASATDILHNHVDVEISFLEGIEKYLHTEIHGSKHAQLQHGQCTCQYMSYFNAFKPHAPHAKQLGNKAL